MPRRKEPRIPDALLDQLLAGADAKTAFDPDGLLDDLKKALAERVLNAEMDHHLAGEELGNRRNGYGKKTVVTEDRKSTSELQSLAYLVCRLLLEKKKTSCNRLDMSDVVTCQVGRQHVRPM